MSQSYKIVTTNLGRTAVRFALAQGTSVKLTHMAVGDGGGQDVEPMSSMTELVRETFRAQINEITFDAVHPDMFTAELFIPQSVGGFYIREVGLFMEDGTLFAVGSMPLTEKPDLSSGSVSDLLIKIIVRVLDASTISISIDPAQVLATRDYVDRMDRDRIRAAVEAHDKEQAAHDYLARKTLQIKAGTGLSGGGTLEADRILAVKYGNTAGTACQGNDARLSDTRTPKAHKDSHKTDGTDALAPGDIGAAPASHTTVAATTTVLGHVKLGTAAGTACQGNDIRLSDTRTPKAHKATHKAGGSDALLPEEIGAARGNRISATTPATAGWYRIAQSAASISNCMGLFEITGAVSGAHSVSLIAAGISFGKAPGLIQLAHVPFATPAITKARIVYHPTYSGNFAYLEVYWAQAKAIPISVNLLGGQGWTLVAPSTAGAVPSGYSTKELTLAEGKIVGDVIGSLTGNAATATKLATPRTIALSGDATASGTFDGSGNLTLAATLKNSGATAGSYGPGANATPAFGASFEVPEVTVDAKGRVTSIAERTVKLPAAPTSVTGNAGTATKWATKRTIDGVQVDGSANTHHYGTCSTAAATGAKTVALAGFVLATGARVTVRFTVTNTAASPTLNVTGTGAKAIRYRNAAISAGYLATNRTYEFVYDGTYYQLVGDIDTNTTYTTATQSKNGLLAAADKKALDYGEAFRLSMIGVPRFWRSTTLPAGHVWANGDLALFADWPELKKVYDGGGFNGMLLAYNANAATIAANLGKWRPNSANPTGLYVPKLGDQFFRAWTGGDGAGGYTPAGLPNITARWLNWNAPVMRHPLVSTDFEGALSLSISAMGSSMLNVGGTGYVWDAMTIDASRNNPAYGRSATVLPNSVQLPIIMYLGIPT